MCQSRRRLSRHAIGSGARRKWSRVMNMKKAIPVDRAVVRWITEFVELAEIDPLYCETSYLATPEGSGRQGLRAARQGARQNGQGWRREGRDAPQGTPGSNKKPCARTDSSHDVLRRRNPRGNRMRASRC